MNGCILPAFMKGRRNYFITHTSPSILSSHLFVVLDLVVQDDAVRLLGFLPRQRDTISGCPVFPNYCDGGRGCMEKKVGKREKANGVYHCSNPWQGGIVSI